jgi:hypothetical protein
MKTMAFLLAFAASLASPALATCYPPAGLSIQQWYSMCSADIETYYQMIGVPGGLSHDNFVQQFYLAYVQSGQPSYATSCVPGTTMCFSGWLRTCESFSYGNQWMTGAQRC